jgi:hypothetical protein
MQQVGHAGGLVREGRAAGLCVWVGLPGQCQIMWAGWV